jgi:hypothetical protein
LTAPPGVSVDLNFTLRLRRFLYNLGRNLKPIHRDLLLGRILLLLLGRLLYLLIDPLSKRIGTTGPNALSRTSHLALL